MKHKHKNPEPFQHIDTTNILDNEEDFPDITWETALQKDLKVFWELLSTDR